MSLKELVQTTWRGSGLFGLRGIGKISDKEYARIQIAVNSPRMEILLIDIPLHCLPYLPDTSPNSDFMRNGCWHHYVEEKSGYEIVAENHEIRKVTLAGKVIYDYSRDGF